MDPIGNHTSKSEAQPNAKQKRYVVLGCDEALLPGTVAGLPKALANTR